MVAVISKTGIRLMPTSNYRARKLLKSGRAEIHKYRPFTIRLLNREDGAVQPVEFKMDTGYQHIGVSICSRSHEYVSEQRDLLSDETERHNDHRKYRRTRRNHLRYRKPRFNNRKGLISKNGFAPSIRNKRDVHVNILHIYSDVIPVTSAYIEMGQFDTQLLKAIAEGKPVPQGTDYQHGERYGIATLREAVFTRDNYKCIVCGRTPFKNGAILHVHHVGYWKHDRNDRLSNLAAVCEKCHTSKNHKPDGKLYGLEPDIKPLTGATFMTMVRFDMFSRLKAAAPDVVFHMTYGAKTKLQRKECHVKKSHTNDAYAMGTLHPKHRTDTSYYKKLRRNNRVLEKFYDAAYIDIRTDQKVKGAKIGCERNNRRMPRNNDRNLRIYHGQKVSEGRRSIRRTRYTMQTGDIVLFKGKRYSVLGTLTYGKYVKLQNNSGTPNITNVTIIRHHNGWQKSG